MSKKLINMNGDLTDNFYRYKMPCAIIVRQGAFYAFTNIDDIMKPKYINRDINSLKKFLNKHFHTSWSYKNNSLITSASINQNKLQEAIFIYVNKFILCSKCKCPETENINDKKDNYNKCLACGNIDEINENGIRIINKINNKINSKINNEVNNIIINKVDNNDKLEKDKISEDLDDIDFDNI